MLFLKKIKYMFMHPQFNTDVIKPLNIESIIDQSVRESHPQPQYPFSATLTPPPNHPHYYPRSKPSPAANSSGSLSSSASAPPPTSTSLTSRRRISTPSNVSLPARSLSGSSCTRRRQHLWLNT